MGTANTIIDTDKYKRCSVPIAPLERGLMIGCLTLA
ncbi:MAG: hypothetical protein ACJA2O_004705, partial [Candidatus Azotimanducaceae bacterium]